MAERFSPQQYPKSPHISGLIFRNILLNNYIISTTMITGSLGVGVCFSWQSGGLECRAELLTSSPTSHSSLRSWRREDQKFKVISGYTASWRPASMRPLSQTNRNLLIQAYSKMAKEWCHQQTTAKLGYLVPCSCMLSLQVSHVCVWYSYVYGRESMPIRAHV